MKLPSDVSSKLFDLVVHAAWADRTIQPEELSAARAAARVLHPDGEAGARGKLALGPEVSLSAIAEALTYRESAVGFAIAAWMALADGVEHPRETAMLNQWRFLTGVPRDVASEMRAVVRRTRAARERSLDEQLRALIDEAAGVVAHARAPRIVAAAETAR